MIRVSSYAILTGIYLAQSHLIDCFTSQEVDQKSINDDSMLIHAYERFDDQQEGLTNFLELIASKRPILDEAGVKKIVVHLDIEYVGQCNWELTPLQLALLHKIKAVFTFSAYEGNFDQSL